MAFQPAGPAEIVRLAQKDEYFLAKLRSDVATLMQKIKGIKWWIEWHQEIVILTDAAYFVLTTILGNQTLGEEYVNVIQVDQTLRKVPSLWRRSLMVSFHILAPYIMSRWSRRILLQLYRDPDFLGRYPNARNRLQNLLPHLNNLVAIVHRYHLVVFYFQVKYYHIAKRLTGTRYVLIRPWLEDSALRWGYWFLGMLSLVQLGLSAALHLHSFWSSRDSFINKYLASVQSDARRKNKTQSTSGILRTCPLCLETLSAPTATPCGHTFCWNCIIHSLDVKQQCPLCSETFDPSRLIFLQNYN